jgi:sarcosine oxidase, subunit beta
VSVHLALPAGDRGPPPDRADLLIIGGGVMGLCVAYHAARLGMKNVVVLDRSYLCSGASGRNGGGVRMQWSTADNVRLMQSSIEICKNFAAEMGINVWFRQGGYLFLVRDPAYLAPLEQNVKVQNECGVPTRMLDPAQAKKIVPELDTTGIVAASYNPQDGVLFPWPFVWGYASRAMELGAKVHTYASVEGFETNGDRITKVHVRSALLDRVRSAAIADHNVEETEEVVTLGEPAWTKTITVDRVVNATGAWSPKLAAQLGIQIPNRPYRHEILTTEPLKAFLTPMVTIIGEGIYFSQSMRGEIVGGMGDPDEPSSFNMSSSLEFLRRFARTATQLLPQLGNVQVVRQWAGLYDVSPDGKPILGEAQAIKNLTFLAGFTGHGFMMAPIIGKLCAERLVRGDKVPYFDEHGPDRFRAGIAANQETMIIG